MSLPAYPAEGQLVAVAGEELACPDCGAAVVEFTANAYGYGPWPFEFAPDGYLDANRCFRCGACGGKPTYAPGVGGIVDLREASVLLAHIRSGTWTGWRSIGAE